MSEKERWFLIAKAFTDDAFLKQLLEVKNLAGIKNVANTAGIPINDVDVAQLEEKLGEVKLGDAMGSKKLTILDAIDAIGKAKHQNESTP